MKKFPLMLAAALFVVASCNKPVEKAEDPTLSVSTTSITVESAGGDTPVTVTANNPWTAKVKEGTDWISVESASSTLTVKVAANTAHAARMGSVSVESGTLSKVISVTQMAAPNNDKIEVSPASLDFDSEGGDLTVTVTANVPVTATSSESWLTVKAPAAQAATMTFTLTATACTASAPRTATVTFSGGDAESVTISVSQSPAAYITLSIAEFNAPSEGASTTVTVNSNVDWTAESSAAWVHVTPASGQNDGSVSIAVDANEDTAERTATVALSHGSTRTEIAIKQDAYVPPTPVEEVLLATWRCDDVNYLESHCPDWSTPGANKYSNGTGKGIGLPEPGAPEGTQLSWHFAGGHKWEVSFISAEEGHYAVKPVAPYDGFIFTIPGQTLKKGQVVTMYCCLAVASLYCPKNWVIKFRTSEDADWVTGESPSAYTTTSGATAHLQITDVKQYKPISCFQASYTIPADVNGATLQLFVTSADQETINGKATTTGSTLRLCPLFTGSTKDEFDYFGPRITIK